MNLRDKLRAVGGAPKAERPAGAEEGKRDCRHAAVYRPPEEFPGASEVRRETLEKMSNTVLPADFDPSSYIPGETDLSELTGRLDPYRDGLIDRNNPVIDGIDYES